MKKILAFCLIWLSFAGFAKPQVILVAEHGFIVENTVTTEHSSDQLWRGLIQDVDLWWPKDHSWWGKEGTFNIDPKAGGCFCEVAGNKSAEHMRISFVEPNKLLRMTGGLGPLQGMGMNGALDWKFASQEGKTVVTLTYRVTGIHTESFQQLAEIVAKVQGIQLGSLISHVESKSSE